MFRRSPLLGAAVVYGASRSAARREVDRSEMRQMELQRDAERRRYQEEERMRREEDRRERRDAERRTRERQETQQQSTDRQRFEAEQQRRIQMAVDEAVARERAGSRQSQGRPPAFAGPQGQGPAISAAAKHCRQCGNRCLPQDRFCSGCGAKLV